MLSNAAQPPRHVEVPNFQPEPIKSPPPDVPPSEEVQLAKRPVPAPAPRTRRSTMANVAPANNDDLAELEELTDDILCECLNTRYQQDKIYTYVGDILIAVNPFQMLGLYTNEQSALYCNVQSKSDHPPHLFAIADSAYHNMKRNGKSQVCVISGESGAGKTESAKQFVRQIMDVSARGAMGGDTDATAHVRAKHPVETKILQQNPILEAFGNAKTVMNDNSSRFGKFIDLRFGPQGTVTGADMSHYLLEKARIVMQGPGERNYHIFGMMFSGLPDADRSMFGLKDMSDYRYLPDDNGDPIELKQAWDELIEALGACGFTQREQDELFSVLAGILHLGNLEFVDGDDGDAAIIANPDCSETISRVLMVDERRFNPALMTAILNMRGESITKKNNVEKCVQARNATAKALYDKLFQWLIFKVNLTLRPPEADAQAYGSSSIGILDIFGFENFKQNGFDQMCINLANEQLHYFFNQHIFAAELGSYAAEGLDLGADTMFHDNKLVLDVFFRRNPPGILGLLDEESRFPKASATSLLNKFNKNLANDELYNVVKGNYAFGVSHYAGDIVYHTEGFLEKNTDALPDLVPPACEASHSSLLKLMFSPNWDAIQSGRSNGGSTTDKGGGIFKMLSKKWGASRKSRKQSRKARPGVSGDTEEGGRIQRRSRGPSMQVQKRGDKAASQQTVSAAFRASLTMLMVRMGTCDPHFIRCIKPNQNKTPKQWEPKMVLRQLTYTGMLQTVKMRREGYPFRIPFGEFFSSYHGIVFDFSMNQKGNAALCTELLEKLEEKVEAQRAERGEKTLTSKLTGWKVAKTMVFLKYWQLDLLNALTHPFEVAAVRIQTHYRRHMAMKRYQPMKDKYADECAMAATLIGEIRNGMDRVFGCEQTLIEEEVRRGPIDLGISKPVPVKELKKAEKQLLAAKPEVDQKKFEKDLNKVKKGVVKWWIKIERSKGFHCNAEGQVHPWFHGLISRTDAEDYLFDQPSGAFLIRVSERVHGYALSFRHGNRIRHYKLGFSVGGGYTIVGNAEEFGSLEELVQYFQEHPITVGDDDMLSEPVQFEHDLGLGITHSDDVKGKAPPMRNMTQSQRNNRSKSMFNTLGFDSLTPGEPMDYSEFLASVDPRPRWLRGKISRQAAETELEDRGMVDGRFLVREKLRSHERVILALSLSFRKKFYHHLLTRNLTGKWQLDDKPVDIEGPLEDVISSLQRKKNPRLATVLEADVPEAPAGVVDTALRHGRTAHHIGKARSNLIPSSSSTVDDVVAWLASLGLAKYAGGFYKAKFTGRKLHKATEKQLRKIVKSEDDYILMVRALR
eukprot:m.112345 g.112345  ORF g.112345 m.112345 type:complete len:1310 (-) comp10779_c2_seq1:47-3976(-)